MIYKEKDDIPKLLESGFYKNRLTGNSNYNYDIFPLINNFDFYEFIDYAEKHKKDIIVILGQVHTFLHLQEQQKKYMVVDT